MPTPQLLDYSLETTYYTKSSHVPRRHVLIDLDQCITSRFSKARSRGDQTGDTLVDL